MYERIKISDLTEEEWLKLRKTGIGGSDAGAIAGVNPFSSKMKVYRDKTTDEVEIISSEALRVGKDLEEYVAQRFCEATGKKVRKSNYMYRSIENPFMTANVDRLIVGEDAILECKTTNAYGMSKWEDGKMPESYLIQCYHYMAVTGKKTVYLACLIMGVGFTYRVIKWDYSLISTLIDAERDFWENYVIPRRMPPADGSKCCDEILSRYFPNAEQKNKIELDAVLDDKLDRREEILKQIDVLQNEQKQIEQEVKLFMKDNEFAEDDKYRVSWSNVESTRLDSSRIKNERPDIYMEYSKTTNSRRFQVKVA